VYETRAQLYAEQAEARHTVAATAIEDSTVIVDQNAEVFPTEAGWRAKGVEHVGSVDLAHAVKAGDQLDVWVDASGDQVTAPTPTWRAGIDAMFAGAGAWLIATAGVVGLSMLVRSWLIRRRYIGWEREWQALVSYDGRTGSQT
jgi:carbohydrate-selective porin OprB